MLRDGIDPLLAADHMSDLHQVVVHDIREVIGRKSVRLHHDLIVHRSPVFADLTAGEDRA